MIRPSVRSQVLFVLAMALIVLMSQHVNAQSNASPILERHGTALFIENVGQIQEDIRFVTLGGDKTLALFDDSIWLSFATPNLREAHVKLSFAGANSSPEIIPFNPVDAELSFFSGNDPSNWHQGISAWQGLRYVDLYPDIDLEIYVDQEGRIAQRMVLHPGGELENVVMQFDNVQAIGLREDEIELVVRLEEYYHFEGETMIYKMPLLPVMPSDGNPLEQNLEPTLEGRQIRAPFAMPTSHLATADGESAKQDPSAYPKGHDNFTRLIGNRSQDFGESVVVDRRGDAYIYGALRLDSFLPPRFTTDQNFGPDLDSGIIPDALRDKLAAFGFTIASNTTIADSNQGAWWKLEDESHVIWVERLGRKTFLSPSRNTPSYGSIVAKIDGQTGDLLYASFVSGISSSSFTKIAVDDFGHIYITGKGEESLPTTPGAYDTAFFQGGDAFALKLDQDGRNIVYGTFLGNGEKDDKGQAIAVDADGNAYITGGGGADYGSTPGSFSYGGGTFVIKLNSDGSDIVYRATVGGGWARDIAVDPLGHAYIAGIASSGNIPTTAQAYDQNAPSSQSDGKAYVLKLSADGSTLLYGTYLGGTSSLGDGAFAISVDDDGSAYIAGDTSSPDFPITTGAYSSTLSGVTGFVTKLNPDGSGLVYSTLIGAGNIRDLAIDTNQNAYVTGMTQSELFPTTQNALERAYSEKGDAFVSIIDPNGSKLLYSTYLGGEAQTSFTDDGSEFGYGIDTGPCGQVFVIGQTGSFGFTGTQVLNSQQGGNLDIFVTKLCTRNEDECEAIPFVEDESSNASSGPDTPDEPVFTLTDAEILSSIYADGLAEENNVITIVTNESYAEDGIAKRFIITQITPRGDFDCRLCYPDVGAAVFAKIDGTWQLESVAPHMGQFGMWGSLYKGELVEIGRDRYGMLFDTHFGGGAMGFFTTGQALMYPVDGTVEFIFNALTSESTTPFCENDPTGCYEWEAEFDIVPNPSRRFHDIVLESEGTRRVEETGEIEPFSEKVAYRFNGIRYESDEQDKGVTEEIARPSVDDLSLDGDFSEIVGLLSEASRNKDQKLLDKLLSNDGIWAAPLGVAIGYIDEAASTKAKNVLINALVQNELRCAGYETEPGAENWVWGKILANGIAIDWKKEFGWGNAANVKDHVVLSFGIRDDGWRFHGYSPIDDAFIQSRFSDLESCPHSTSAPGDDITSSSQAVSATPTPEPQPTSTPQPPELTVLVSALNVRDGPGTNFSPIGQVTNGDILEIIGRNSDGSWLQICCVGAQSGWVINNSDYVRLPSNAASSQVSPVSTPTPAPTSVSLGQSCSSSADAIFMSLWRRNRALIGCPTSERFTIPTIAEQLFEGGHMFWHSDKDEMFAVYDRRKSNGVNLFSGQWQTNSAWKWDGSNPNGIGLSPPSGRMEPKRGFGFTWRNFLNQENGPLGWALDREYGFDRMGQIQFFENGFMFRGSDPKVYLLLNDGRFFALM